MTESPAGQNYLKIDPPLAGQNWTVLSFISPEDMILKRNLYYVNHFLVNEINKTLKAQTIHAAKKVNTMFDQRYRAVLSQLTKSVLDVDKEVYNRLRKIYEDIVVNEDELANECLHEYAMDYDEIHDRFQIYQTENMNEMDQKFSLENEQRTSIRGLKVRGVFNTRDEADERAKFLNENVEPNISNFVAPIGYWLPWDPNPDAIKESHYQNEELNKLMAKYQENVQARNKFFEERKQEMLADNGKTKRELAKERLRQKLKERQAERKSKK